MKFCINVYLYSYRNKIEARPQQLLAIQSLKRKTLVVATRSLKENLLQILFSFIKHIRH
jgi:hypothetical protein